MPAFPSSHRALVAQSSLNDLMVHADYGQGKRAE